MNLKNGYIYSIYFPEGKEHIGLLMDSYVDENGKLIYEFFDENKMSFEIEYDYLKTCIVKLTGW